MVNPNLIKLAKRQMNDSLPIERAEPREESPESKLAQILERDENGKPKLDLTPIKKTAVNSPTQEKYDILMQVYECGGWKWSEAFGELPTRYDIWSDYEKGTCVDAGDYDSQHSGMMKYFNVKFYQQNNQNIISPQQFYETQNITPEMLNEINIWFDENGKS